MSKKLYSYKNVFPNVSQEAFIQDGVRICGQVSIESDVSIWFNSTIRADYNTITLKKGCNVQELTSIHVDHDYPTVVGELTTIGHSCVIHGATIGQCVLVGMHSTLLNGCVIGDYSIVGAKSLVTQNSVFEPYSLILGSPAKFIRTLTTEEVESIKKNGNEYIQLSKTYLNDND